MHETLTENLPMEATMKPRAKTEAKPTPGRKGNTIRKSSFSVKIEQWNYLVDMTERDPEIDDVSKALRLVIAQYMREHPRPAK